MIGNGVIEMRYKKGKDYCEDCKCFPERAGGDGCCLFCSLGLVGMHERAVGFCGFFL